MRWNYLFLDEASGYGVAARRCMAALDASGVDVIGTPFVPGSAWGLGYEPGPGTPLAKGTRARYDVTVAHLMPEYFPLVAERSRSRMLVGHTVWETDKLPAHWPACLEAVDLLVVPCRDNAEVVRASGVSTPVAVVPHIADGPAPGTASTWADIPRQTFVFYTIGEWTDRKAVFHTIRAYLRAFTGRDQVLLVVKTSPRDFTRPAPVLDHPVAEGTTGWAVARLMAEVADPPAVRVVTRQLADGEVATLHHRGDCFVSLCRGEGWGLGAFDAATYGNPVVTTGWGGHLDYLGSSAALIDYDLIPVHSPNGMASYSPDQHWAEPRIAHAIELLQAAVTDRRAAKERAARRALDIRSRYGPAVVAAQLRRAVESRCARHGRRN